MDSSFWSRDSYNRLESRARRLAGCTEFYGGTFGAMLLQATAPKNKELEAKKDNVVSLDEYRRQRHGSAFEENQARLQNVFETQYLHEAEMMASMLESEGIPTHLFNRHNASILIHPMSEMQVKVLVPHDEVEHALALIGHHRNSITPEDSSIA